MKTFGKTFLQVFNMIHYLYILQNAHRNESNSHLSPYIGTHFFPLMMRTFKIHSLRDFPVGPVAKTVLPVQGS